MDIGRYKLSILPKSVDSDSEFILSFYDQMEGGHSNPEEEGVILIGIFSLLFNTTITKTGFRINDIDCGIQSTNLKNSFPEIFNELDDTDYSLYFSNMLCMSDQIIKQFVRASHAYSMAIRSFDLDISLSFLLLVTAIECLSTQEEFISNKELNKDKHSAERYCRFVNQFCEKKFNLISQDGEEGFLRNLKTVYYVHRSGFVHGGKEVSVAAKMADRSGRSSMPHIENGKEVFTPGIFWFFNVVRNSLLGFLKDHPKHHEEPNYKPLSEIARDRATLTVKFGG